MLGAEHNYTGVGAFVGGIHNTIGASSAVVLTGGFNSAVDIYSIVGAGALNKANAPGAAIFGGTQHDATAAPAGGFPASEQHWMTILGGSGNRATAWGATVSGGANLTESNRMGFSAGGNATPAYHSP